jgi:uncharacterized RDD family membrane protein YckC
MTEQQTLLSQQENGSSESDNPIWRDEIQARVAGYRSRRGRRVEGAFSMRFPFPAADAEEVESGEAAPEGQTESVAISDPEVAHAEVAPNIPSPLVSSSAEISAPAIETLAGANIAPEISEAPAVAASEVLASGKVEISTSIPELALESDPGPRIPVAPRPRPRRKVIAFPRPPVETHETFHRLADPVLPEQPRILDVPEELEAYPGTPLLDGLHLPASAQQTVTPHDHIELPFQAAALSRRIYAGVIDCAVVAGAAAVFLAVGYKMLPGLPLTKPLLLTLAAVPLLLWAAYQYVFVLYGGVTAGMRLAGIRLRTFKGASPNWRHRRTRVIGLYFSAASLMMGLLWATVDVDGLCWHDRISRTYLTSRE